MIRRRFIDRLNRLTALLQRTVTAKVREIFQMLALKGLLHDKDQGDWHRR